MQDDRTDYDRNRHNEPTDAEFRRLALARAALIESGVAQVKALATSILTEWAKLDLVDLRDETTEYDDAKRMFVRKALPDMAPERAIKCVVSCIEDNLLDALSLTAQEARDVAEGE